MRLILLGMFVAALVDGDALTEFLKQKRAVATRDVKRPGAPITSLALQNARPAPAVLADIAKLPELAELHLYSPTTDDDLFQDVLAAGLLTKLSWVRDAKGGRPKQAADVTYLYVPFTKLTDRSLPAFAPLKNVREAILPGNAFTAEGAVRALVKFEKLEELTLTFHKAPNPVLGELKALKHLRSLTLGHPPTAQEIAQFADFPKLQTLRLSFVTDDILKALGAAKLLHLLYDFHGANNTRAATEADVRTATLGGGPLTEKALQALVGLTNLETLRLGYGFPGNDAALEAIAKFTKLRELNLNLTHPTAKGFRLLGSLQELRDLNLTQSHIDDAGFKELTALKNLRKLTLSEGDRARLTAVGLRELAALPALEELHLRSAPVDAATLAVIAAWPKLARLTLSGTEVNDATIGKLAACKSLRTLSLLGTRVTEKGLAALAPLKGTLTRLLPAGRVSDTGSAVLADAGLLHTLYEFRTAEGKEPGGPDDIVEIAGNSFDLSDAGLKRFAMFKNVRTVSFVNNRRLTDEGLGILGGFAQLESANLIGVPASLATAQGLAKCANLEKLYLGATKMNDASLAALVACKKLRYLDVAACPITDAGLASVAKLPELRELVLVQTPITDAGLKALAQVKTLEKVALHRTKVTAAGFAALQTALPGCQILR